MTTSASKTLWLSGEPKNPGNGRTARRQIIVKCKACGRHVYLCCAYGDGKEGFYHWECRPDYHDPKPPQSCADLPQHLTFDGEPPYTDERS
jgi:hypothetical protein